MLPCCLKKSSCCGKPHPASCRINTAIIGDHTHGNSNVPAASAQRVLISTIEPGVAMNPGRSPPRRCRGLWKEAFCMAAQCRRVHPLRGLGPRRTPVCRRCVALGRRFNPLRGLGPRRTIYGIQYRIDVAGFQSAPRLGAAENGLGICVLLGSTRNYR
jgi:hypothetical protein